MEAPEHVKEGKAESRLLISAANRCSSTNLQFAYGRSELCFIGCVESFHNFGAELNFKQQSI